MIGFVIAGLVIGALARLLLPGRQRIGLLVTLLLGVIGSVIGGVVANAVGSGAITELNVFGFIVAVLASIALLAAAERTGLATGNKRSGANDRAPSANRGAGGRTITRRAALPALQPALVQRRHPR